MIQRSVFKPVTEDSHPFLRAELKCNFKEIGYAEDEYFIYGTANVYEEDQDENPIVIYKDASYVNRVLIRRPKDITKFSGNVVVEILNPSARMDIDRMWVNSWKFFTRNGDIYIGITSKSDVLQSFYDFDSARYGELSWKNPLPDREPPKVTGLFGFEPKYEFGLFWDMLTDFTNLIKGNGEMNPLRQYGTFKTYLTGWSQSAGYVIRYVKTFAFQSQTNEEELIFDGYLAAGGGVKPAPINTYSEATNDFFSKKGCGIMGCPVPYIAVNTESENSSVNWKGDSDVPGYLFRVCEFPGSSHDSEYNLLTYYKDDPDTGKIGMTPVYYGIDGDPNDYPYEVLFNAVFRNLYQWVRTGIPALHADRIPLSAARDNITDAFGNAVGGVRTAAIDYPTARYYSYSTAKDGTVNRLFGHIEKFSPEFLRELYGTLDHYRDLITANTDMQVAKGFIIPEDAEKFIEQLVQTAAERGLK